MHKNIKNANNKNMKNYYKKSKKEFINFIKKNPYCSQKNWDEYAHENCLFSAFTLECHVDAYSFKELKRNIRRLFS